jgi:N-acylglucosamine-6-phosphate 2-epimerase
VSLPPWTANGAAAILDRLRGGLIVSVQADADSVLNTPETIALLARCAVANGAVGVRIEGAARIAAVRAAVSVPIVGIVKRVHTGFEPYITSTVEELAEVAAAGAELVAFDATLRARAGRADPAALVAAAHGLGLVAMADCSDDEDAANAVAAGADVIATTLAGYTPRTRGRPLPALDLVAAIAERHPFTVCEGGVGTPGEASAAFGAGASAVVVGTAISNVDALVRRFAAAVPRGGNGLRGSST